MYSENPITAERMLPYMEPLKDGSECRWRTAPGKSRWFAYKVREALTVISLHPERFPELATHATNYRISVTSSSEVLATPKPAFNIEVLKNATPQPKTSVLTEASTVAEITNEWFSRPKSSNKLYLPNAQLSSEQLLELYQWTEGHNTSFFYLDGALTLTVYDPETAPYAWSPEDLEER